MSCQFEAGMPSIVTPVSSRRYLVIDEENQVASAIATFDHRGNRVAVVRQPERRESRRSVQQAVSVLIFESFIDGRGRQIAATVPSVPYEMHPG